MRSVAAMTFQTTLTTDRTPVKATPVKSTPAKATPPRQSPPKPLR